MELVPSYPTSPRYFATFDFIRPVRAVTVNFMDRSRSRQAGTRKWVDPAWKTRTTRADPPPCSSFPFFLNRRNGKSSPIFFFFAPRQRSVLPAVVVIHDFSSWNSVWSCTACRVLASRKFRPVVRQPRYYTSQEAEFWGIASCFRRNSIDCFFFFDSDFIRLGRKSHGWWIPWKEIKREIRERY